MMHELFMSPFFGIGLSIAAFWVGTWIRKKTGLVLCNPLVLAIVIVSGVLLIFKIPYEEYNEGGALINMFLAPATACLAVSIYTRAELLKKNWLPIVVGASCGSLASMGSVLLMCKLFGMDEAMTVSFRSPLRHPSQSALRRDTEEWCPLPLLRLFLPAFWEAFLHRH